MPTKPNPTKCMFWVPSGQLLGFLVSNRGIEASTKQVKAILDMKPPEKIKDIQKLIGCMVMLHRFISRLGEKGIPFFKLLKKSGKFEWTEEADEAFKRLKEYLTSPPVMVPPNKGEDMLLYISATKHVVSAAVVVEREEPGHFYKVQRPVYYISEVLTPSKAKYIRVQKVLYAILITSRKLRHYFQEHKISIITNFLLRNIL